MSGYKLAIGAPLADT